MVYPQSVLREIDSSASALIRNLRFFILVWSVLFLQDRLKLRCTAAIFLFHSIPLSMTPSEHRPADYCSKPDATLPDLKF
jgi:hypothetical protein